MKHKIIAIFALGLLSLSNRALAADSPQVIAQFYTAFSKQNFETMIDSYSSTAVFHDPIFGELDSKQVKAMWQMLVSTSQDFSLKFTLQDETDTTAHAQWIADYTYPGLFGSKNHVHNIVNATFSLSDGKITNHNDSYDFGKWISMALGLPEWLGDNSLIQQFIRDRAKASLMQFIQSHPQYQ